MAPGPTNTFVLLFATRCLELISVIGRTTYHSRGDTRRSQLTSAGSQTTSSTFRARKIRTRATLHPARTTHQHNSFLSSTTPRGPPHGPPDPRTHTVPASAPGGRGSLPTLRKATLRPASAGLIASAAHSAPAQSSSPPLTAGPRQSPVLRGPMAVSVERGAGRSYGLTGYDDAGTRTWEYLL